MSPLTGNAIQKQGTIAQKTLPLGSEFLAGLGWFCTLFPHISRTLIDLQIEEVAESAKSLAILWRLWWTVKG
jgi:hypothetical protein